MATLMARTTWSLMPPPSKITSFQRQTPWRFFRPKKKKKAQSRLFGKDCKGGDRGEKRGPESRDKLRISASARSAGSFQSRDASPSNRPAIGTEVKCWLVIGSSLAQDGSRSPGGVGRG